MEQIPAQETLTTTSSLPPLPPEGPRKDQHAGGPAFERYGLGISDVFPGCTFAVKEVVGDHEPAETSDNGEHLELLCTESLPTEEQFHTNENTPSRDKKPSKSGLAAKAQILTPPPKAKPGVKRLMKYKASPSLMLPAQTAPHIHPEKQKAVVICPPEKKRQTRMKKLPQEEHQEVVTVIDELSVVPLGDVQGDLEFEDLEPEDLEVVRHLPNPGNVQIVGNCRESMKQLREFEKTLQDVLVAEDQRSADLGHDSDATISIISDDEDMLDTVRHSAKNPPLDMSMLLSYKYMFDPPVPAVVTVPTSIVNLRAVDDWETESKALQYLFGKRSKQEPDQRKELSRPNKRKRKNGIQKPVDVKRDEHIRRLIAAIEIKSNQSVHLQRPVFSLQYPLEYKKKPVKVAAPPPIPVAPIPTAADFEAKVKALVEKLDLAPFCRQFLESNLASIRDTQLQDLRKAAEKSQQMERGLKRKLSYSDTGSKRSFHGTLLETQKSLKQLAVGKERATLVAKEKYHLDVDEIEKRLHSSTEKAKSHVINMFEENRRQYELQKTLDFATCKCDMLSINTRNMRRRGEMQTHPRMLDDFALNGCGQVNPTGSPPHSSQCSIMAQPSSQGIRRRRNNFASTLKETLEDREIYDDLARINHVLKSDPEKARLALKSAEVIPDNNRLTIDGKQFHRNQPVMVEHHEQGRYPGILLQFSQTEIVIKKTADGQRLRFPLGLLMDKRLLLKKRSATFKGDTGGGNK